MSERIGLESLPSDGKLSRSAHSLRVVHALREAIVSGRMPDGAPLVETAIARDLNVSRGPVRTALHELHAQGLVEITPTGRSSVVGFDHDRLLDLLSVRWQLESQAVRWGLERRHSLEDVFAAYAAIESAEGASGEEVAELDMAFHRALVAFSGSRALMSAWSALAPVVTTVLVVANRRTQLSASQLNVLVRDLHTPIIDGLLAVDADEIARLLQRQFEGTDYLRRVQPVAREGEDVTLVSYSFTVRQALEAAEQVAADGISVEVIDLRTVAPLDRATINASVRKTGRAVLLSDAPTVGGVLAEVAAGIQEAALEYLDAPIVRLGGRHSPIPHSPPLFEALVPSLDTVTAALRDIVGVAV